EHLLELGQGRDEDDGRRDAGRLGLGLERLQHHPEDREEEDQGDQPGNGRPRPLGAPLAGPRHDHSAAHRLASTWKIVNRVRSAKVATIMVRTTATTPIADALPMSKPWKATR